MEAGTPANQSPNPETYIDRPLPRAQFPSGQGKKRGKKNRRERTPETEEDEPSQEYFIMGAGTDSQLESKDELEKEHHTINQMDPPEIIERANFHKPSLLLINQRSLSSKTRTRRSSSLLTTMVE